MTKKYPEFLIDTDIILDYLFNGNSQYLINLLQKGICFTTVLNASEIILKCKSADEIYNAKSVLSIFKVLGIHARYSLSVNTVSYRLNNLRDILFIVTAEINKIDILTLNPEQYVSEKVRILHPESLIH